MTSPPESETDRLKDLDKKIAEASKRAGIITPEEHKALADKQSKMMFKSAAAGLEFATAIAVSTLFGIWLDKKIETSPVFMLIFLMLGTCVAFYNIYRASEKLNSSAKDADSGLHQDKKDAKKTPD